MTVLWFAPKPARYGCSIRRAHGNRSRTAAADPSSEALSRTTTSRSTSARSEASESRQARRRSRLDVFTIETETSGAREADSLTE
jgi:hypothetical protein